MLDIIMDTLIDSVRLLPFLFLTYLGMEWLEHKTSAKTKKAIKNSGKLGPIVGALLGAFPQCGFSTAGSNLYAGRVISLGTLIAIYLSTSDEMLPVFLSEQVDIRLMLAMIGTKVVIGMVMGLVIDIFVKKSVRGRGEYSISFKIGSVCDQDGCNCNRGVLPSAIIHTVKTLAYIAVFAFVLNTIIFFIGEETLGNIILNRPVIGPMIAGLVGLIPNCASSVVITQMYLAGIMSIGATMAGLLAGAGVGIVVLFKENKNIKENVKIIGLLYAIGVVAGIIIDVII